MACLVLLPGMDGTGTLFSEFISALPKVTDVRIVAYPPDRPLGYAELEAHVLGRLPTQPFILVGESFSGPIAIAVAAAAPPQLRGVVLVCSFAKAPMPPLVGALASYLPLWRAPAMLANAVLMGRYSTPSNRERLSAAMHKVSAQTWRARLRAVHTVDVTRQLQAAKVPILYLRASGDRLVRRSAWHLINRLLPSAQLAELEGPHFLLQAKPVESAARIAAFAREAGLAL
jgi:pimeloyl-ACP methyl ester carboxylesterase